MAKKFLVIAGLLFITGCGTKYNSITLFYKERDLQLTNSKGELCKESGIRVTPNWIDRYYSNCDLKIRRTLKEFEPKQWGLEKDVNRIRH